MSRLSLKLSLVLLITVVRLIDAQCVTSTYVPCFPAGGGTVASDGVPDDDLNNAEFWASLQSSADAAILKRGVLRHFLASRQNALCCKPTDNCVLTDSNVPFCYNPDSTEFYFSDKSFGFVSNGTYYAADGTFVDFKDGYYSATDGSTGTFPAATAGATSSNGRAAATSTTARAGSKPTSSTTEPANLSPGVSSSVGSTPHNSVTSPTSTPSSKSGSASVVQACMVKWLGLCVAILSVFLA